MINPQHVNNSPYISLQFKQVMSGSVLVELRLRVCDHGRNVETCGVRTYNHLVTSLEYIVQPSDSQQVLLQDPDVTLTQLATKTVFCKSKQKCS